jgi:hypothetical protein
MATVDSDRAKPRGLAFAARLIGAALLAFLVVYTLGAPAGRWLKGMRGSEASLGQGAQGQDVDWHLLGTLDVFSRTIPPGLEAVHLQIVRIPGYLVPLEDDLRHTSEFLLVPYFGACSHLPPPPENQMVYVQMVAGEEIDLYSSGWDPVWVTGKLHVEPTESPYGVVGFRMDGLDNQPYVYGE